MRSSFLEDSLICETSMCPTAMRQGPPWSAASLTADIDVTCIHGRARQNSNPAGAWRDSR